MATNKGTRKRVPPSQERYEESHPVISVRVSPEIRERLELLKNASGTSAADVLRIGLDLAQPAIEGAFNVGYGDAEWRLKVTYWCSGCGRDDLSVETPEEAEARKPWASFYPGMAGIACGAASSPVGSMPLNWRCPSWRASPRRAVASGRDRRVSCAQYDSQDHNMSQVHMAEMFTTH